MINMWKNSSPLLLFVLLQVLDVVTTVVAITLGGSEMNPVVGQIMTIGPLSGLLFSKLIVVGLATAGAFLGKQRGIRVANIFFVCVIVWNFSIVARLAVA